jgi:23S rRNA (adenine2030-N6)-methyltransferase
VERSGIRKILRLELLVRERDESGLIPGCGMLVIAPPWHFKEEAEAILHWLAPKLVVSGRGSVVTEWLVRE